MEISLEKSLTPENDLQELWEMNGRVKAVLAWIGVGPKPEAEETEGESDGEN